MLPSLAPIESEIVISTKSSKPCFTSIENIVPDENSCLTDETSYGRPAALASRKAANIGLANTPPTIVIRSEERRVGKEWVSTCRSGGWPDVCKKKTKKKK